MLHLGSTTWRSAEVCYEINEITMSVIFVLILVSMTVAGGFLGLFIWASRSGQFDDTVTPSMRMLFDNKSRKNEEKTSESKKTNS